jgi:hypothetical protein
MGNCWYSASMKTKTLKPKYEKRTYHLLKSHCKELDRLEKEWNREMGPGINNVSNADILRIAIDAGIKAIKQTMAIEKESERDYEMREMWLVALRGEAASLRN